MIHARVTPPPSAVTARARGGGHASFAIASNLNRMRRPWLPIAGSLLVASASCSHRTHEAAAPEVFEGVMNGAYNPANPLPAPALPRGVYEGEYVHGFETSAFTACGSTERWWTNGTLDDITRFEKEHPDRTGEYGTRLFLRVEGTPSATGNFGHLGSYPRELQVHRVIEVHEYRDNDCASRPGA